ncbi:hypothetical protein ACHAQA_004721 [Verticillium albo-atrum]
MSFPHGSSIFTFGDAPLPHVQANSTNEPIQAYSDPTFSLMLSKDDTSRLLQRYFDFVVPVDRFLHRPTIEAWYEEFHVTMGMMRNRSEAPTRTALLFMVFALAQQHINPKPTALEAEMRLSRVLSGILKDIYSIRPTSSTEKYRLTAKYTKDLEAWRADMSRFLDPDANAAPLIPIFQRQRNVLNLAYWHTMILTHRPLLLSNFARLRSFKKKKSASPAFKTEESVRQCLEAATNIVDTVNNIIQAGQLYRAFWFTPYFAFSASVILYVYTIQKSDESDHTYSSYFAAATRCQNQLANIAEPGSLVARYCLILEELRTEAIRQIDKTTGLANGAPDVNANNDAFAAGQNALLGSDLGVADGNVFGGFDFNVSPSDSLAEMTSWGQFDSMVGCK